MSDLYFTEEGDLTISPSGDLAMTQTEFRDDAQQAYIRVLTDQGDYLLYPEMGASLSELIGEPQAPRTGKKGEEMISSALNREGRFDGKPFTVKGVPTGPQSIRFDVNIVSGNREQVTISVEQELEE